MSTFWCIFFIQNHVQMLYVKGHSISLLLYKLKECMFNKFCMIINFLTFLFVGNDNERKNLSFTIKKLSKLNNDLTN